jgi:hypothetical protein
MCGAVTRLLGRCPREGTSGMVPVSTGMLERCQPLGPSRQRQASFARRALLETPPGGRDAMVSPRPNHRRAATRRRPHASSRGERRRRGRGGESSSCVGGKAGAPCGERPGAGLLTRLINRALVDDLAIIQAQLVWVGGTPPGDSSDMEVLDAVHVRQREGKPFSLFGCDKFIDIDGMDRLITGLIATTVAKRLPASGDTG